MCAKMRSIKIVFTGKRVVTPNDPKLSDRGVRRGTCMAGGKAAAEAGAVTHGAVRCSAWLGPVRIGVWFLRRLRWWRCWSLSRFDGPRLVWNQFLVVSGNQLFRVDELL